VITPNERDDYTHVVLTRDDWSSLREHLSELEKTVKTLDFPRSSRVESRTQTRAQPRMHAHMHIHTHYSVNTSAPSRAYHTLHCDALTGLDWHGPTFRNGLSCDAAVNVAEHEQRLHEQQAMMTHMSQHLKGLMPRPCSSRAHAPVPLETLKF
jgi:diadenosine tetraphosphate (Ap4A) HIT family hydrolase